MLEEEKIERLLESKKILISLSVIVVIVCIFAWNILPPDNFPSGKVIIIAKDQTLNQTADQLQYYGFIRSALLYKGFVILSGGYRSVKAGGYRFTKPQSVISIAYKTVKGIHDLPKIKVTIPEGVTVMQMAKILSQSISGFDAVSFIAKAKPLEGYLFPDTYFFQVDNTVEDIIRVMEDNFELNTRSVEIQTGILTHSFEDVIKMASIVEKEATSTEDRKIIAGILWKRIKIGMALQVDPPFYYFLNKSSALTLDDLKVKSPYNTYLNRGLPPTPIGNPGLDAISATINPVETKYFFYLSGNDGKMHYAVTHEGHVANKFKYLK